MQNLMNFITEIIIICLLIVCFSNYILLLLFSSLFVKLYALLCQDISECLCSVIRCKNRKNKENYIKYKIKVFISFICIFLISRDYQSLAILLALQKLTKGKLDFCLLVQFRLLTSYKFVWVVNSQLFGWQNSL